MWLKNVRYLDYNAGSGLSYSVREKIISLLKSEAEGNLFWANPSSRHRLGQNVAHFLYQAKSQISVSLGCTNPDEIIFTSSGSEANQSVIRSIIDSPASNTKVIIGAAEHSASLALVPILKQNAAILPVLSSGQYDVLVLERLIQEAQTQGAEKILVSLAWANNETGVIQNLARIQEVMAHARTRLTSFTQLFLHLDCAQVWGKLPIDVSVVGADYLTFSGHKIGAFAGVGLVWKAKTAPWIPLIPGDQQHAQRGGSENALGIIALGYAATEINPKQFSEHTAHLRNELEAQLIARKLPITIWGTESDRISNTSRFSLLGFKKYENWVELLDVKGFAVSHASACKSQIIEPSKVLLAMGATQDAALNSIRVSLGMHNTLEDIIQFSDTLEQIMLSKSASKKVESPSLVTDSTL